MTEKEINEAKELRARGMTYSEIGTKLGYSQTYISRKLLIVKKILKQKSKVLEIFLEILKLNIFLN